MRPYFILLIASFTLPRLALACSCAEPPPPQEARSRATGVFVGKATSREILVPHRGVRFTFEVEEAVKGKIGKQISITTGYGGGDCGWAFQIGQRYLVYAHGAQGELSTSICSRTKLMSEKAAAELKILR